MNQAPNRSPDRRGDLDLGERGGGRHRLLLSRQLLAVSGGVLTVLLITLAVQLFAGGVVAAFSPSLATDTLFLTLLSGISMYLVAMPFSYFVFRLGKPYAEPARGRLSVPAFFGLLVISFGIAVAGSLVSDRVQALISLLTGEAAKNPVQEMTSNTPFWTNLLVYGLLAPIMEEIVYRKIVIDRLRPFGDGTAVVASGLIFGLVHGNLSQVFYATLFGLLAGIVYVYTGKLRYTLALHVAVNLVGGVFTAEANKLLGTGSAVDLLYAGYSAWLIFCLAATPVLAAVLFSKYSRAERKPECMPPRQTLAFFVKNPGIVALAAMLVLLFLV